MPLLGPGKHRSQTPRRTGDEPGDMSANAIGQAQVLSQMNPLEEDRAGRRPIQGGSQVLRTLGSGTHVDLSRTGALDIRQDRPL